MNLRDELCKSIDNTVDREINLGAGDIAAGIEEDFLTAHIQDLEDRVDNAHSALIATLESGGCDRDMKAFIKLGLDNKQQDAETKRRYSC